MTDDERKRVIKPRTDADRQNAQPTQIADFLALPKQTPRQLERLKTQLDHGDATDDRDPKRRLYVHSVFCQTAMPYRDPGAMRMWERSNGQIGLQIAAGAAWHPEENRFVEVGLPFGPKPRLLLAYINTEALTTGSRCIEAERSLTSFVKSVGLDPKGRNIRAIKDQLARLAASTIRLGMTTGEGHAVTIKQDIITGFELWLPKDERQRVLWPSMIELHPDYFDSLTRHAVPLHPRALMALSGNAMALDAYCWLAQRLHRVTDPKGDFIPWPALQTQFGLHYTRLRDFRRVFIHATTLARGQYRAARFELDDHGMTLWNSPTPVKGRTAIIVRKP